MDSIFERFCLGYRPTAEAIENQYDPSRVITQEEQLHRFGNAAFALYWQAERARQRGISWRGFCVGCAAWSFREDASTYEQRWRYVYGMNTKVEENSRNICAEPISINAAYAAAHTKIIGMVVVGETQTEANGRTPKTLRPCAHCRFLMKNHPLIKLDTIIITALPPPGEIDSLDEVTHEVFTFEELLKEYNEL